MTRLWRTPLTPVRWVARRWVVWMLATGLAAAAGSGPARAQEVASASDAPDSVARSLYLDAVAHQFTISRAEVSVLAAWDIDAEEIPVVLHLSRLSGVSPDVVVALRNDGRSWPGVAARIGVSTRRLLVPLASAAVRNRRRGRVDESRGTRITGLPSELSDQELVDLVNLQLVMRSLGLPPERVLGVRSSSDGWIWAYRVLAGG